MTISTADPQLTAALACVDTFYERMFRDWPTAINERHDTYTLSYSGDNRLTGANHLWLHSTTALQPDVLRHAIRFFETFGAAWSVIFTNTHMPEAGEFLLANDFHVRWRSPLMVLDTPPAPLPIRPELHVTRASTSQDLVNVRRVMSEAFATRRGVNERVARIEHLDDPTLGHYLIMDRDEPAASATIAVQDGMTGVWNVGTRHAWRRQGYATAIIRALLDDQRALGSNTSMLMASPSGQPLYERLGYREIGLTYYVGPPYRFTRFER